LLGKPGIMIHVEGRADLIQDKAVLEKHWTSGLDRWFEQGVGTPGAAASHRAGQGPCRPHPLLGRRGRERNQDLA